MKRWGVRGLVIGTVLLCLGVGGYAGQVWWARKVAEQYIGRCLARLHNPNTARAYLEAWAHAPWCGHWGCMQAVREGGSVFFFWEPRSAYHVILMRSTGLDLGNDPEAWEAWFKVHPNLVWDEKQRQLVDAQSEASKP